MATGVILPPPTTNQLSSLPGNSAPKGLPCIRRQCRYVRKVLININDLRKATKFCDVVLMAGDAGFKAHKAVLSASSPYFHAMFNGGLAEQEQSVVSIRRLSPVMLSMLLDFIYTGDVDVTEENVQELILAADMLELSDVVEICSAFLKQQLEPSNAIGIYRFSEGHNLWSVSNAARAFINGQFAACSSEEEFLEVPHTLLMELVRSEALEIDSEYQVFEAALRWVAHDIEERRRYVFDILCHIRLPLIPSKRIETWINDCCDPSLKVALRSMKRDLDGQMGCLVKLCAEPRHSAKKTIYVIGGSKKELVSSWTRSENALCSTECFDTFNKVWRRASPMRIARILPGVAVLNGRVYVVGGEQESLIMANGEIYNPQEDQWSNMACMISPRVEFGLAAVDGKLYAMGGWVGVDIGGTMEVYDPDRDEWTLAANLPAPRFSMGVVAHQGLIFLVGGCTHSQRHLHDLVRYSPSAKQWTELAPMGVARSQMGVAVLDDYLYAVGGIDRKNEVLTVVERYSFEEDRWEEVKSMTVPRTSPSVAAANGLLYVIGGDQNRQLSDFYRAEITVSAVEVYDPLSGEWSDSTPLPESRSEAGAVVI
ncbi:actin-binding protein IPP-like [Pollicipes pollicipes]|uniref:actin-binding protein IPP-like n=1 Tax=Pollicipes pollicipes TaxID=41117 RepID=UPI001884F57E|nr:actin-binding protein IPP-like [Pollicipes pollicipes]